MPPSHFLGGDGAWDEVDFVDIQNPPVIYSTPAALRSAIGAPTASLAGLMPNLPASNQRTLRWMRADGTWQQLTPSDIQGLSIPTLRDAAQTRTLLGLARIHDGHERASCERMGRSRECKPATFRG